LMYGLNVQVTAYGLQTVPDKGRGQVMWHIKIFGAAIILPEWLNLVVKFCTQVGYININNRITYHQQKGHGYGHVTGLKFCRLSW